MLKGQTPELLYSLMQVKTSCVVPFEGECELSPGGPNIASTAMSSNSKKRQKNVISPKASSDLGDNFSFLIFHKERELHCLTVIQSKSRIWVGSKRPYPLIMCDDKTCEITALHIDSPLWYPVITPRWSDAEKVTGNRHTSKNCDVRKNRDFKDTTLWWHCREAVPIVRGCRNASQACFTWKKNGQNEIHVSVYCPVDIGKESQ